MEMKKKTTTAMMSSSSSSSSLSSSYLFSILHEDLIIDEILLKLPLNSLLSLRYVSGYFHSLITSPSFIKKHLHHHNSVLDHSLLLISSYVSLSWDELGGGVYHHYTLNFSTSSTDDPSRPEVIQIMHCPFESTGGIQASCNGLLFLDNRKGMLDTGGGPAGYIWNPCYPKEYKEVVLPPPPPSSRLIQQQQANLFEGIQVCQDRSDRCCFGFCGFGYDSINEEYKILYYENRVGHLPDEVSRIDDNLVSITEFKLYKLGTNTWTSICSDNPFRYLFFGHLSRRIGTYVNGALHWIMSSSLQPSSCSCAKKSKFVKLNTCCVKNAKIISFDMKKEEFREIQKPHYYYKEEEEDEQQCYSRYEALQVLQGCLCVCEFLPPGFNTTDIWMLKDYAVKDSWTKLFTIVLSNEPTALWNFRLLRLCENGEIVMTTGGRNNMNVYDPVKHISRPVENLDKSIKNCWRYEVFYTESLVSLSSYIS